MGIEWDFHIPIVLPLFLLTLFFTATSPTANTTPDLVVEIEYVDSTPSVRIYENNRLVCDARYEEWAFGTTVEDFAFLNMRSFVDKHTGEHCLVIKLWEAVRDGRKVLFKLGEQAAGKYHLEVGLNRYALEQTPTSSLVSLKGLPAGYVLFSRSILDWREPIIIYNPDKFDVRMVSGVKMLLDKGLDSQSLEYYEKGVKIIDELRRAYGEVTTDTYLIVFVTTDIPDPYGRVGGAHNFGSVSFIQRYSRPLEELTMVTVHELAHAWFALPYVDDASLSEGGSEFSSMYFVYKVYPNIAEFYTSAPGVCRMIKIDPTYGHSTVYLSVINGFLNKLSNATNTSVDIEDLLKYSFAKRESLSKNEVLQLPWDEASEKATLTFERLVTLDIPEFLALNFKVAGDESLYDAMRHFYQSLLPMSLSETKCEWPFYNENVENTISKFVESLLSPQKRVYVHVEPLSREWVLFYIYNINSYDVRLKLVKNYSGAESDEEIMVPKGDRLVKFVRVGGSVDKLSLRVYSPLRGTFEDVAEYDVPSLVSEHGATVTVALSTTISTITETLVETTTVTKTSTIVEILTTVERLTDTITLTTTMTVPTTVRVTETIQTTLPPETVREVRETTIVEKLTTTQTVATTVTERMTLTSYSTVTETSTVVERTLEGEDAVVSLVLVLAGLLVGLLVRR